MKKMTEEEKKTCKDMRKNAYKMLSWLVILSVIIIIVGIGLSDYYNKYIILPFSIIILGIIVFFSFLRIANYFSGTLPLKTGEVRQAITASIVVVYLGLLPILAFKGIMNVEILNQTANSTLNATATRDIELTQSVITDFTYLVGAVILFYFGSRNVDNYINKKVGEDKGNQGPPGQQGQVTSVQQGQAPQQGQIPPGTNQGPPEQVNQGHSNQANQGPTDQTGQSPPDQGNQGPPGQ